MGDHTNKYGSRQYNDSMDNKKRFKGHDTPARIQLPLTEDLKHLAMVFGQQQYI